NRTDAVTIGHLVNSRGAVELAMALILLNAGLISIRIFTLVAAVGLVTTVVAPIGATHAILKDPERRAALYRRVPSLRPGPGRRRYRSVDPEEALWGWSPDAAPSGDLRTNPGPTSSPNSGSKAGSATESYPSAVPSEPDVSEAPPPLPRDRRKPGTGK
ncbi:MAG: hypothetical protein ACREEC_09070, partial [Thermoplasmata archaeon]